MHELNAIALHALRVRKFGHDRFMSKDVEENQRQQGERLKEARKRAGFKSGSAAARAIKIPVGTYNGYENGSRGIFTAADQLGLWLGRQLIVRCWGGDGPVRAGV